MLARDKQMHFAAGLALSMLTGLLCTPTWGLLTAVVVGALKEISWDRWLGRGTPEFLDFVATVLGGALGAVILHAAEVMRMELEQRVTRLEERTVAVERDIKEIKAQLNETAKKSDVERLENTLEQRDANYTKNLWKLIFILIAVFTAITLAAVGLSVADISLPTMLGGSLWFCVPTVELFCMCMAGVGLVDVVGQRVVD